MQEDTNKKKAKRNNQRKEDAELSLPLLLPRDALKPSFLFPGGVVAWQLASQLHYWPIHPHYVRIITTTSHQNAAAIDPKEKDGSFPLLPLVVSFFFLGTSILPEMLLFPYACPIIECCHAGSFHVCSLPCPWVASKDWFWARVYATCTLVIWSQGPLSWSVHECLVWISLLVFCIDKIRNSWCFSVEKREVYACLVCHEKLSNIHLIKTTTMTTMTMENGKGIKGTYQGKQHRGSLQRGK